MDIKISWIILFVFLSFKGWTQYALQVGNTFIPLVGKAEVQRNVLITKEVKFVHTIKSVEVQLLHILVDYGKGKRIKPIKMAGNKLTAEVLSIIEDTACKRLIFQQYRTMDGTIHLPQIEMYLKP
jgi:hypothetical protein